MTKQTTEIPGFDTLALGGLPAGSATLVAGTPGSGKTVFAISFLIAGLQKCDANAVFVTFEESPERIRNAAASLGWDISDYEADDRWRFVDAAPRATDPEMTEIGRFDFAALVARIENAVKQTNAKRVVLDSLSAVFSQFANPSAVRFQMFRVAEALRDLGVRSLITAERLEETSDSARFGVEDFVVDCVVVLRNRLDSERRRRTIEILKFRSADHIKGEFPFTITAEDGLIVIPVAGVELSQKAPQERVPTGIVGLDEMMGGGIFRASVTLLSGATGCGKTLITTQFIRGGVEAGERCVLFGFEESIDQLKRNSQSLGTDYGSYIENGQLIAHTSYPEMHSIENHLLNIRKTVWKHSPDRVVIDSLSALERSTTPKSFREFIVAATAFLKEEGVTAMFTLASPALMGGGTVTEGHVSSIADAIILLRYVEVAGEVHRGLTVLKMRGSQHDKGIREFHIDEKGIHIGSAFRNLIGILAGNPTFRDFHDSAIDDVFREGQ